MYRRIILSQIIIFSLLAIDSARAQTSTRIKLQNPSFEGIPSKGTVPSKWLDCGSSSESPPDIQPNTFGVTKAAHQGNTYMGLVVRDNDTREAVGQRLTAPILGGTCYKFSIWLCRSEFYLSKSSINKEQDANYSSAARFNVYAGNDYCQKLQLIGVVDEVKNTEWQEYFFEFKANADYRFVTIEANHKKLSLFPYNGNVLVDQFSDIAPSPCPEQLAGTKPKPRPNTNPKPKVTNNDTGAIASVNSNTPNSYDNIRKKPKVDASTSSVYDRRKLQVGQTIRIENLYFDADSTKLRKNAYTVLDELYQFMSSNTDISIEIGGHTNDTPTDTFCDRLSTARARAVSEYLVRKGIHESRVQYRGYGKRNPLYPNVTAENRKRNQRVEVKILSIG